MVPSGAQNSCQEGRRSLLARVSSELFCRGLSQMSKKFAIGSVYIVVSAALTVVNKLAFSNEHFHHVNLLVCAQQLCVILALVGLHKVGLTSLGPLRRPSWSLTLVILSFICYVLSSLFGLKFVSVPLYTTLRKLGILTTLALEYCCHKLSLSRTSMLGILLVVFGAVFAGRSDLRSSALGYAICLCCNFFTSAYLVSVSYHKDKVDIGGTDLVFQCALYSLPIFFTIAVLNGEASSIGQVVESEQRTSVYLVVSSILAGLLNVVTVLNIRLNSSIGQNLCANLKDVVLILFSVMIGQSQLDLHVGVGVACTMVGAFVYSFADYLTKALPSVQFVENCVPCKSCLISTRGRLMLSAALLMPVLIIQVHTESTFYTSTLKYGQAFLSQAQEHPIADTPELSVLATVTGGWAMAQYKDDPHGQYLDAILSNYLSACEFGFRVKVVLVTHDTVSVAWLDQIVEVHPRWCHRRHEKLDVEIAKFPMQSPPEKSFGTGTDLAVRHREIFVRERANFDVFVSQEDDVKFTFQNLKYFIDASAHLGTWTRKRTYHPFMYSFERIRDSDYIDWRMRYGNILKIGNKVYYNGGHQSVGCCGYIVLRETLDRLINGSGVAWQRAPHTVGEFNPQVASWSMLQEHYTMVLPIADFEHAGFHHMPNKYIKMGEPVSEGEQEHRVFATMTSEEQRFVFSSCLDVPISTGRLVPNVTILQNDCKMCLRKGRVVQLRTTIRRKRSQPPFSHWVEASLTC